jgi:DNA-directed RNA polymerase subunit beta
MRFHITFAVHRNTVEKAAEELGVAKPPAPGAEQRVDRQPQADHGKGLLDVFNRMELDPDVTHATLGERHNFANVPFILRTTKKLLHINAGKDTTDDRDSLAYQVLHGPEDFFAERIMKDAGQMGRKMLWRATLRGNVQHIPSGVLTPQLRGVLMNSGMGQALEEVNPMDIVDQNTRIVRLGEGGISSVEAIPDEARGVQPSHFGFIDPIRSPEGLKIGIDSRAAHGAMKGSDGHFYTQMVNQQTGQPESVSASRAAQSIIAFPGEMEKKSPLVRAMVRSRQVQYVERSKVDYALPKPTQMFNVLSNIVPMIGSTDGGRLLMGSKFSTQALPLKHAEAPLVQSVHEGDQTFHRMLGGRAGAVFSEGSGVVTDIGPDGITVRYAGGRKVTHELFNNFPFNRKTFIHNTPVVKIGDQVKSGQPLARSNFTDDGGTMALGANFRTAYTSHYGDTFEDAIVISESAARRLSSEHLYQHVFDLEDGDREANRKGFMSLFPAKFKPPQLKSIGENGVIRPGAVVHEGDPLVLALQKTQYSALHRGHKPIYTDATMTWDHSFDGVVTDVDQAKDGSWNVTVKAYAPM